MENNKLQTNDIKKPNVSLFGYLGFFFALLGPVMLVCIFFFWFLEFESVLSAGSSLGGLLLFGSLIYLFFRSAGVIIFLLGLLGIMFGHIAKSLFSQYEDGPLHPFISPAIYLGYVDIALSVIYYILFFTLFHSL